VLANSLSHQGQILHTDWSLSTLVFAQICQALGTPQVDLFATSLNTKLLCLVSPYPDPLTWDADSLSLPWEGIWGFAFPPSPLIPLVLNKIRTEDCKIFLVAPLRPRAHWYNQLLQLLVDVPRSLPPIPSLLSQPHSGACHHLPESLTHHAWTLSSRHVHFQRDLSSASLDRSEFPLAPSMMQSGKSTWIGVVNRRSIHSVPLFHS